MAFFFKRSIPIIILLRFGPIIAKCCLTLDNRVLKFKLPICNVQLLLNARNCDSGLS